MLRGAHADFEQDIECLNTQRENTTHDMVQAVTLDAKLEGVRLVMEELVNIMSKHLFQFFFVLLS